MPTRKFLRRKAASDYLRETHGLDRAPSTLAKLAVIGGGPIFCRAGRVPLYSPESLDTWVASLLTGPMRSTTDTSSAKSDQADQRDPPTQGYHGARENRAPSNAGRAGG
jgi:hypothetical protein